MRKITEDTNVKFKSYDELSYEIQVDDNVILRVKDKPLGLVEVWFDSEQDDREYICINYEIIYLDDIRCIG